MHNKLKTLFYILIVLFYQNANSDQISQEENEMSVNVIVTFNAKKEKLNEFIAILKNVKKDLPSVNGCNGVKIYNDSNSPLTFTLVESWSSKDLHKKHITSLIDSGAWNSISEHLQTEPTSSYFSEL